MKREAVIAGLASEGLALLLGSAEAGSSAVVRPTPTTCQTLFFLLDLASSVSMHCMVVDCSRISSTLQKLSLFVL